MSKRVALPAFVGCCLFALAGAPSPSVADESVLALINKKPTQVVSAPVRKARIVKAAARPSTTVKTTAAEAKVVLPDPSLLTLQPAFDCTFKGPVSSPITAEETRMKLDYEAQCYRQSEAIVRARLEALQVAVGRIVKRVAQQ
jgi:hypothetical protein